jgi:hypothetical protein
MTCNITVASMTVTAGQVTCDTLTPGLMETIVVTGTLTTNRVEIENSSPIVVFKDTSVNTAASVIISGRSATIIAAGTNTIRSTADGKAGIECSSDPNITIQAAGAGSLIVMGGEKSAGIGTSANRTCRWVTILNGSVDSHGGTGIGNGWGEYGSDSKLEGLSIHDRSIQATGRMTAQALEVGLVSMGVRQFGMLQY